MTLVEFIDKYKNGKLTIKEMTTYFNELTVPERKLFLDELNETNREKFIIDVRQQAVDDFWLHERQAILAGKCTRDWTPEQIESIINIDKRNGGMCTNAGKPLQLDANGEPRLNKKGKEIVYQGHHMLNVNEYPEYAADWRNIQALDNSDHLDAHKKWFKNNTNYYYDVYEDVVEKRQKELKIINGEIDFEASGYPPKRTCVFKSSDDMKSLYSNFDDLTDAEKLALKNVDLASRTGDIQRFNAGIDLAERYNSTDLINKIGLKTDAEIKQMYGVLKNCNDPHIINQYRLYEYSTRHGCQMDAVIYVDKDGNILGTSLDKTYIPDNNDYQLSMTESTKCLSNAELKSHSNLVKVEDA